MSEPEPPYNAKVRAMAPDDWPRVRAIYADGIASGHATFETTLPEWDAWDDAHLPACRFVCEDAGLVIGWAALSPVSKRRVYAGVAEVSVYVSTAARGRGIGRRLLEELVRASEASGLWTLQAGIFPENEASLAVHRHCGFREVGRRERIGALHGEWRDVLLLERRSASAGTAAGGAETA